VIAAATIEAVIATAAIRMIEVITTITITIEIVTLHLTTMTTDVIVIVMIAQPLDLDHVNDILLFNMATLAPKHHPSLQTK
jgi:hypothetical protein